MKNIIKLVAGTLTIVIIAVIAMAVMNICPPQGPWPAPPWCAGSSIPWPFSDPNAQETAGQVGGPDLSPEGQDEQVSVDTSQEDTSEELSGLTENERLARVAVGLVADLSTVNSYFNDAASSIRSVGAGGSNSTESGASASGSDSSSNGSGSSSGSTSGSAGLGADGMIPAGFMDPLSSSGYIPAPAGACAAGASPSASFQNGQGETITPELMAQKDIQVIDFETLTGGTIDGRQLESTLTSLITPGDPALINPDGWNQKVWSQMAQYQKPAESLLDYHLWSASADIEAEIVASMTQTMQNMGLPPQVINAFQKSASSGWYAGPRPQAEDRIAAMEIEAIFSGRTEGIIRESRDFSLPELGQMPVFGPMTGEGDVVYHDPELGEFPFEMDLEWTKWDELGRVTEGLITFTDAENGVLIEMEIFEDGSRIAYVIRDGTQVGVVRVTPEGEIEYEDLTG